MSTCYCNPRVELEKFHLLFVKFICKLRLCSTQLAPCQMVCWCQSSLETAEAAAEACAQRGWYVQLNDSNPPENNLFVISSFIRSRECDGLHGH